MVFVNYLPKLRYKSTDNSYASNFQRAGKDLFADEVALNASSVAAFVIDSMQLLRAISGKIRPFQRVIWFFSRHTFHLSTRANIVISHWFFPVFLGKKPILVFSSGFHPNSYGGHISDAERLHEIKQLSKWFRKANAITFPATSWIAHFNHLCPDFKKKIFYAPHLFHHLKGVGDISSFEKFNETTSVKLLFVGRDGARKGLPDLLDALELIRETAPNVFRKLSVTVVSKTTDPRLKSLNINCFQDLPHEETIRLMKSSHVFCLPTRKESFGHVFIEAMACCCAIICDDKDPRTEFFNNGESAQMIEPGNIEGIKSAILKYVEMPELMREHGKINFERYNRLYSYECAVETYHSIIDKLIR